MSDPRQRLFFALWPDEGVRAGLAGLARSLPEHKGRSPHPMYQHVTLVFLGELDAAERACAEGAAGALDGEPFELAIDRVGYWPRPRILWCAPSVTPEPLLQLVQDLQEGLRACGLKPERRPYAPHITLARKARGVRGFEMDRPIPWRVRGFVLVASVDTPPPPRYQVLREWPLEAPARAGPVA